MFKSNIIKDAEANPENLGAPFNSQDDDFAIYINSDTQNGFVFDCFDSIRTF